MWLILKLILLIMFQIKAKRRLNKSYYAWLYFGNALLGSSWSRKSYNYVTKIMNFTYTKDSSI